MSRPALADPPVVVSVRVPTTLRNALRAEATARSLTLSAWVLKRLSAGVHVEIPSEPAAPIQAHAPVRVLKPAPEPGPLADQPRCPHPKARQRDVMSGKKCLDCGEIVKGFF